jgi:endonuclease/exonuclease/phosphatase family metal-dependent hydrolase
MDLRLAGDPPAARPHPRRDNIGPVTLPRRLAALVIASCLIASTVRAEEEMSLALASYNVWNLPLITPDRGARIDEIARRLAAEDVDIVALQELWVPEDAGLVADVLGAAGLVHSHYFGPNDDNGSGLFVASRYPIDDVRFDAFRVGTTPYIPWHVDWLSRKGVGIVRLQTPLGLVDVANTHLHASYAIGDYAFVQLSQALQINDVLGGLARPEETPPLLLVGDLNVVPSSLPHRALVALGGLEPARPDFVLDHVLARSGSGKRLRVEEVRFLFEEVVRLPNGRESKLSDHPCVLARYALSACSDCASTSAATPASWSDVSGALAAHLRDERSATQRSMRVSQILGVTLLLAGVYLLRRLRNIPRRRLAMLGRLASAFCLVTLGGWLGYLGWHFAPKRIEEIAATEAVVAALQPAAVTAAATF